MVTLLTVVHITVCLFLILVVLLQAGKGGGMGIAFGGAGSQTVFGSSGAGNFLTRLTSITATVFLLTSLALAHYSSRQDSRRLQQLASEKAAEKKSDDEKAAKLKADMEKIRAASAGGASGGAIETTPGSSSALPLQLKMPGTSGGPASRLPVVPTPSEEPAPSKTEAPSKAKKKMGAVEGSAVPPAGDATPKPVVVKMRKPAAAPASTAKTPTDTPDTVPPVAPQTAPAPAAPAQ